MPAHSWQTGLLTFWGVGCLLYLAFWVGEFATTDRYTNCLSSFSPGAHTLAKQVDD
jgi:hypothetical protein